MGYLRLCIVLEEQPDNLDVMMSLATVYEEQGNEEKALELVDYGKLQNCPFCISLILL